MPIFLLMNKMIVVVVLGLCAYFGHRQYAAAQAYKALSEVASNPQGAGGFKRLQPIQRLTAYLEPGRHTVFIFSAQWCPACRALESELPQFVLQRPDVAIRSISVDDAQSTQAAMQNCGVKIRSIPHVVIYDSKGELVARDDGSDKSGYEVLTRWVSHELQHAAR